MRGRVRAAGLLGAAVVLTAPAACANGGTPPAGPPAASSAASPAVPVEGARWVSCAAQAPEPPQAQAGPRLAADFVPVAVTLCREGVRQRPGGGTDAVLAELRATDVAALVAALRLPPSTPCRSPRSPSGCCGR